jgi:hypothetical protein
MVVRNDEDGSKSVYKTLIFIDLHGLAEIYWVFLQVSHLFQWTSLAQAAGREIARRKCAGTHFSADHNHY